MLIFFLLGLLFLPNKELRYDNWVYEDQIKTVRLFPATSVAEEKLRPSVIPLSGQLWLEFDDLQSELGNYTARIYHCNYDWTPSSLRDLDFLRDFNEFNVTTYEFSGNTHQPYVHYRFEIPPVKVPGNYVLAVFRDGNRDDLMLTRRFMVYAQEAIIKNTGGLGMTAVRATNHQLQFEVNYNRMDIPDPLSSVNVVIRQNQRWDNAQWQVKPSFIRPNNKTLEYRFFNDDKSFKAGNEYRLFDMRSVNYPGQNTARLDRSKKPFIIYVADDYSRAAQRYAAPQFADLNGGYIIANVEEGYGETNGHYVRTVFTLKSDTQEPVYVLGAFNDWQKNEACRLEKSPQGLTKEILLKQGFYNYIYESETDAAAFEGSHFETENIYEILVYNRAFMPDADLLVGYLSIRVNGR
jgi:hypothetical protein